MSNTTHAIIAGSANFGDYELFCKEMDFSLSKSASVEIHILCLFGSGTEKLAHLYVTERGYQHSSWSKTTNFGDTLTSVVNAIKQAGGTRLGMMIFGNDEQVIELSNTCVELGLKYRII